MQIRKAAAAALIVGLVLGGTQPGQATTGHDRTPAGSSGHSDTVTLLTGDRVSVDTAGRIGVRPGAKRNGIRFLIERDGEALHVVPDDAAPLLRSGRLDPRLFDVRGLLRDGYGDAQRATLPLLVTYRASTARSATSELRAAGVVVARELSAVGGAAVNAVKDDRGDTWAVLTRQTAVERVWLDGRRRISLDHSVPQIGAPDAWRAGYTGSGVTVAVLDTGVDTAHPDLAGKVLEAVNFTDTPEDGDTVGHGTHVASTIAGSAAASAGRHRGVAPDAKLLSGKVCETEWCSESAILAGMHWAAADKQAAIVNMSLGTADASGNDPLEEAVNTLTARYGTLFVVSAGNEGADGAVSSPSSADAALSVGAVDRAERRAPFSNRGPRVGEEIIKPDITAPGVGIVAARAEGTAMGEPVNDRYTAASGTSMATPHVAGVAALFAQRHPQWRAEQLKASLMAAAQPNPSLTTLEQGAGRVDAARAVTQIVITEPTAISFGRQAWPHDDDQPISRVVTYRNVGSAPITLTLSMTVTGPGAAAAPGGMFRTSTGRVTVPAAGTAAVTVTTDTRVDGPDGRYTGHLIASADTTVVHTPLAINKEDERYDLTVSYLDGTGTPTQRLDSNLTQLDGPHRQDIAPRNGTATVRVPKGRYSLSATIYTPASADRRERYALILQPVVNLDRDTRITLDARQARPVSVNPPKRTARIGFAEVGFVQSTTDGPTVRRVVTDSFETLETAHVGSKLPSDQLYSFVNSSWGELNDQGRLDETRYLYLLAETVPGRLPTGYTKSYQDRELATVRQRYGPTPDGMAAISIATPVFGAGVEGAAMILPVPKQRDEYLSTGPSWMRELGIGTPDSTGWIDQSAGLVQAPVSYQPTTTSSDEWQAAPTGPVAAPGLAERRGDRIQVNAWLFGDRAGHPGWSTTDTARTALYRNGRPIGETTDPGVGEFDVPAGTATYRLEASATRSFSALTTSIYATWTFRSARVSGDRSKALPLSAIRYAPKLNASGSARAASAFSIPISVQPPPRGTAYSGIDQLTVEISYDDGATWTKATVRRHGAGWRAIVQHPAGPGYASLRATAVDRDGATTTQTIERLYRLR
ncbi:S8 family serine peptidase [Micromonospora sp. NBC_00362]|uniref:S8 family serine peptidase n=1 Tax=Micromonospora sp. NBC_00362 TaxID=2975975 RepID=UPI002252B88C|nr:S8 family serine peptidase [Micromonospora sp. NBC_00362]MCX5121760.1 S8 family serine peptidase [Micromonospora sp. NBC_00362]